MLGMDKLRRMDGLYVAPRIYLLEEHKLIFE